MLPDETIGDTLAIVNLAREAFGFQPLNELPDARPGDSQDCLYFRALKDIGATDVGTGHITFSSERQAATVAALWGTERSGAKQVVSPKNIRSVISSFDRKETPHYNV